MRGTRISLSEKTPKLASTFSQRRDVRAFVWSWRIPCGYRVADINRSSFDPWLDLGLEAPTFIQICGTGGPPLTEPSDPGLDVPLWYANGDPFVLVPLAPGQRSELVVEAFRAISDAFAISGICQRV